MTANTTRAVSVTIYGLIRVSTQHQAQDGLSLEQQRSEIVAYAVRHGLDQPKILVEEGVSGFKTEKREFHSDVPLEDVIIERAEVVQD